MTKSYCQWKIWEVWVCRQLCQTPFEILEFYLYATKNGAKVHSCSLICFLKTAAAAAKSLQSCPTLCDTRHGSPPGSPVPGILQAWTLEWVAISFSNAWKWKVKVKSLSRVRLLATPWTAAYQVPPSMGLSRQGYRSGVPSPSPTISLVSINEFFLKLIKKVYSQQCHKWYVEIIQSFLLKSEIGHECPFLPLRIFLNLSQHKKNKVLIVKSGRENNHHLMMI